MTGVEAGRPRRARQWSCGQSLGTCAQGEQILKHFWRFWFGFPPDDASLISYLLITSKCELISPLHRRELRPCLRSPSATISALVSVIQTDGQASGADGGHRKQWRAAAVDRRACKGRRDPGRQQWPLREPRQAVGPETEQGKPAENKLRSSVRPCICQRGQLSNYNEAKRTMSAKAFSLSTASK